MTITEIKEKLEQLQNRLFLMNMKDRWTPEDEIKITEMENKIHELEMAIA